VRRPEWLDKDVFWPEGGFWLGERVPDVPYAVDGMTAKVAGTAIMPADCRVIVAPTDRLMKRYTARVGIALLAAAVEAYRVTYSETPARKADLWQRPEWAGVWPDGGFAARIPDDPWETPLRMITEPSGVMIEVRDWYDRRIKAKDLTPEEKKALEAGGASRLSEKELAEIKKLVDGLRDDELESRESAVVRLLAWGPAVADLLDEHAKSEKDPEVTARVKSVRERLKVRPPAWAGELLALRMGNREGGEQPDERTVARALKTFTTAQADFRMNDRDGNLINDFWVKDVAGLYGIEAGGAPINLIAPRPANADTSPNRGVYEGLSEYAEPESYHGYFFSVLEKEDIGAGPQPLDAGDGRNRKLFGFVAYPAEYGVTGTKSFIVSADNTLWWKDVGGETVTVFPGDPAAEGWRKLE
jgi:hypothetical protein